MNLCNCDTRRDCTGIAVIASIVLGVIAVLLEITGVIVLTDLNVIALLIAAVAYLAVTLLATAIARPRRAVAAITTQMIGILGTIASSAIYLLRTVSYSTITSAVFSGILVAFAVLMFASTVCFIRSLANTND